MKFKKKLLTLLSFLMMSVFLLTGCSPEAEDLAADVLTGIIEAELPVVEEDVHTHVPAETPQMISEPVISGYCGNTVTTVYEEDGGTYSFWGSDSVSLTDILLHLSYEEGCCRCIPEYTVDTEFGTGYGLNLSEAYARYGGKQATLTEEQVVLLMDVMERVKQN